MAQDLKLNVVTTGSHNASPEAKRRTVEDHDWEDLEGHIFRLLKVTARDMVRKQESQKFGTIKKWNPERGMISQM